MSFYGKVINYLAKAFASIKVGNTSISASSIDDTLELKGDNYITLQADVTNKKVLVSHAAANGDVAATTSFKVDNADISNGATLTSTVVKFDSKGHQLSCDNIEMALNINGEKTRAVTAESQLQTNIDNEAMRAQGVEKSLSERIGYAETTDEDGQVVPPSGVYVALKTESDRAKTEEQALKDEIINLKDKDLDLDKKIDKVKADILGDTGLLDTYDTLQKIEEWIQGPGVNSTELTEAIANEAKLRQETDDALSTSISQNRTDIDKHQASLSKIEGDATVENSIKWHVAQEATLRAKADGELSTRIDDHKTKLDTIENAITTLNSDATIIGSVSNTVSEALKEYETKQQAAQKLTDAKAYTDSSIAALDVSSPYGEDSYYVANISQVDGKIIPQWRALPFDLTSIAARYDEETGNLTLPINTIMVAVVENGG